MQPVGTVLTTKIDKNFCDTIQSWNKNKVCERQIKRCNVQTCLRAIPKHNYTHIAPGTLSSFSPKYLQREGVLQLASKFFLRSNEILLFKFPHCTECHIILEQHVWDFRSVFNGVVVWKCPNQNSSYPLYILIVGMTHCAFPCIHNICTRNYVTDIFFLCYASFETRVSISD